MSPDCSPSPTADCEPGGTRAPVRVRSTDPARPAARCSGRFGTLGLVARDMMSELRRALHSGDGVAMVTAASAAGFDCCLQLVGEVLIAALDYAAAGADDLVGRCVAALRVRDWDGDQQLADTLVQVRSGVGSELIELAVDLEQLADLLDASHDSGPGRLDLVTGEAWPGVAFEDEWTDEPDDDEADDGERWLAVWPLGSRAAYRDMVDFAATRTDAGLVDRLEIALDGRGAFGRFKHVLADWPTDLQDWFAFSDDRRRGRARAWLVDAGYRARPSRPTSHPDDAG
jgi:hypothetical protein